LWQVDQFLGWSSPPAVVIWLDGFETKSETNKWNNLYTSEFWGLLFKAGLLLTLA
jgi:hypothetical protein